MYTNIITKKVIVMNEFEVAAFVVAPHADDSEFDDCTFDEAVWLATSSHNICPLSDDCVSFLHIKPCYPDCVYDESRIVSGDLKLYCMGVNDFDEENVLFVKGWMRVRTYMLSYIPLGLEISNK